MPGDSKWPLYPLVGGHLPFKRVTFSPSQKGHNDWPGVHSYGCPKKSGAPKWMVIWFIMENPIKNGWFGGKTHYFWKHPYINHVMCQFFPPSLSGADSLPCLQQSGKPTRLNRWFLGRSDGWKRTPFIRVKKKQVSLPKTSSLHLKNGWFGILVSFWDCLFSGDMFVLGSVPIYKAIYRGYKQL